MEILFLHHQAPRVSAGLSAFSFFFWSLPAVARVWQSVSCSPTYLTDLRTSAPVAKWGTARFVVVLNIRHSVTIV